jgi:hypothetical protein
MSLLLLPYAQKHHEAVLSPCRMRKSTMKQSSVHVAGRVSPVSELRSTVALRASPVGSVKRGEEGLPRHRAQPGPRRPTARRRGWRVRPSLWGSLRADRSCCRSARCSLLAKGLGAEMAKPAPEAPFFPRHSRTIIWSRELSQGLVSPRPPLPTAALRLPPARDADQRIRAVLGLLKQQAKKTRGKNR